MKFITLVALAAMAGAASAGGNSFEVKATTVGASTSKYVPQGETHVHVDLNTIYTMPEDGTPIGGNTGDCFGYMVIAMGAGASGSGTCVWTDAEGDMWFGPWTIVGMTAERATHGNWTVSGGTGKFDGASGGGSFVAVTNPQTGEAKLDVAGSMAVK